MKYRLLFVLILAVLLGFTAPLFAEQAVSLSHFGRINDLLYDSGRGLLFSAGEDGTVRVWDPGQRRLLGVVRVSHQPVRQIAVHPTEAHVAVLVGDELQPDRLEVWNWQRNQRLFAVETDKQMMHFAYSPKGSYLFYSQADYKSLTALNPRTGRVLPYMGAGFGIVSYFTVARNEGNIMTYQPSGLTTYWDIRTGRMLKQVKAPANLEMIRISPDNRYIAAFTGRELVLVDILSGGIIDSSAVIGVMDLGFSPGGDEIAGLVSAEGGIALKKWYFGGRYLIELTRAYGSRHSESSCLVYGDRLLYIAAADGAIAQLEPGGGESPLVRDNRLAISDTDFAGSAFAVASSSEILIVDSEFFLSTYNESQKRAVDVREMRFDNPYDAPVGVRYLDGQRLLIWPKDAEQGGLSVLNTWYGGVRELPIDFLSPIRQVTVTEIGIIVVEESGRCRILDPATFTATFQYNAPGMNKLVLTFAESLIGAKTRLSAFSGPLLQINRRTGETVPIQDDSLFVYDLFYSGSGRGGQLFTLAVQQEGQQVRTAVKRHSGYAFERSRVVDIYKGEDLAATITGDDSGNVFSSLGYESVKVFGNSGERVLESSFQIPRKLTAHNGKLFALNRDSSVSVWDIPSGRLLQNIYVFEDGSWAAQNPGGGLRFSFSRGEDSHVP